MAPPMVGEVLDVFDGKLKFLESFSCGSQKLTPRVGNLHATGCAVKKSDPELFLKILHCLRQCRLGDAGMPRSDREAAKIGDSEEACELPDGNAHRGTYIEFSYQLIGLWPVD